MLTIGTTKKILIPSGQTVTAPKHTKASGRVHIRENTAPAPAKVGGFARYPTFNSQTHV